MDTEVKLVTRNALWLGLGEAAALVAGLGSTVLLTRGLGVAEFGRLNVLLAAFAILGIAADLGLTTLTVRQVAASRGNGVPADARTALRLKLMLCLVALPVSAILFTLVHPDPSLRELAWLGALAAISLSLLEFGRALWRGQERLGRDGAMRFAQAALLLGVLAALLATGTLSVANALMATAVSALAVFAIYRPRYSKLNQGEGEAAPRPYNAETDTNNFWQRCRPLLWQSWPFALSAALISIYYYVDTVMLSYWRPLAEVGLYSAAYRVLVLLLTGAYLSVNVLLPTLARLWTADQTAFLSLLRRSTRWLITLGAVLVLIAWAISTSAFGAAFGQEYSTAAPMFQVLLLSLFLTYSGAAAGAALQGSGYQKRYLAIAALGVLVNVSLNLWAIPRFGAYGAAWATVVTELAVTAGYLAMARQIMRATTRVATTVKEHAPIQ